MSKKSVLVVEDEIDILEVLVYNLEMAGYRCYKSLDGEGGLALAREKNPDLILLDLMLPGMSGSEICSQLRQDSLTRDIPIIMVTAKSEEADAVIGLGIGADDYVTKPFRPKELMARIAAVLRRSANRTSSVDNQRVQVNGIVIDSLRHEIHVGSEQIEFTVTEFRIIQLLASQPGRVFSREQISAKALGQPMLPSDRNVDVHIKSIRKKLGGNREVIETIRGVGYKFADRKQIL
ncbi:MAG: two-component system alkaline phosphatase synthesis response regulator PhoP [Planctomycetota bacterium]|jgi:two-component system alkaline phosphatase synthesis response regulator PhoP